MQVSTCLARKKCKPKQLPIFDQQLIKDANKKLEEASATNVTHNCLERSVDDCTFAVGAVVERNFFRVDNQAIVASAIRAFERRLARNVRAEAWHDATFDEAGKTKVREHKSGSYKSYEHRKKVNKR